MESLAEFIFTTAAPSIAWLPKFHNTTTTKLLQKRKAEVNYNAALIELQLTNYAHFSHSDSVSYKSA